MTLERHRSKLIPDIDFSGDGRLFVTNREGTFPLRHKDSKKSKEKAAEIDWKKESGKKGKPDDESDKKEMHEKDHKEDWEHDPDYRIFDDLSSYRSFDPVRDVKRKYKPKQVSNYEKAMREITGTISSQGSTSSLNRRVRRSRSTRSQDREGRFGTMSSGSSGSSSRFRRGQTPSMPPEMRDAMRRNNKRYRSLDVNELRKAKRREVNNNMFDSYKRGQKTGKMNGHGPPPVLHPDFPTLEKQLSEEKLPKILFIIIGTLLILCGIVRLLLSNWHEYFHPLWTGSLLLLTGLIGACHRTHYLDYAKNISYIVFSALSAIATMVAAALIIQVLVPLQREVGEGTKHSQVLTKIEFSYWDYSLIKEALERNEMIYLSLVLDYVTLVLSCVGFYSLTAMLVCIDNFMDATAHITGECDHKGTPKYFNPQGQLSLAQASILIGIVVMRAQVPDSDHYLSPFWAPLFMLLAAFASVFYGKRPDLFGLGWLSTSMQVLGMLGCGVATVLMTLGLVQTITELDDKQSEYKNAELIASACFEGAFILVMIINIVFSVGVVFRHFRLMCCAECFEDYGYGHHDDYAKHGPHYDVRL